jgi:hypothetical protein
LPSSDIKVLIQFLSSTERHQALAFSYLGDCFRDNQRTSVRVLSDKRAEFYTAVNKALVSKNEQLLLRALRVLWNMSFQDRAIQGEVLEYVNPAVLLSFVSSHSESVQYRMASLFVNLCHLEPKNHSKFLGADPKIGDRLVRQVLSALDRGNDNLTAQLLSLLGNLASSGLPVLKPEAVDVILERTLFSSQKISMLVTEEVERLCSNIIFAGKPDGEWLDGGFKPRVGQKSE